MYQPRGTFGPVSLCIIISLNSKFLPLSSLCLLLFLVQEDQINIFLVISPSLYSSTFVLFVCIQQPSLDSIFLMLLAYMSTKYTLGILSFQATLFTRCNWALKFHVEARYKILLLYKYILTGFGIHGIYHQCQNLSVPTAKQQQKFFLHNCEVISKTIWEIQFMTSMKVTWKSRSDIVHCIAFVVLVWYYVCFLCCFCCLCLMFHVKTETFKESFAEILQQYLW